MVLVGECQTMIGNVSAFGLSIISFTMLYDLNYSLIAMEL